MANDTLFTGWVAAPQAVVHIRVHQNERFIHCLGAASRPVLKNIVCGVEELIGRGSPDFCRATAGQSRLVRQCARQRIAAILAVPEERIQFRKRPAGEDASVIPEVLIDHRKAGVEISFSHDGRFVAYALWFGAESESDPAERKESSCLHQTGIPVS